MPNPLPPIEDDCCINTFERIIGKFVCGQYLIRLLFLLSYCKITRTNYFVFAAGPGRTVVYSLADSADGSFSIDKSTGIVVLERILDREIQPSYQIKVRASDQGSPVPLSSLVNVTITVLDINDNPPVFERRDQSVTIPEDVVVGTKMLTVYAASKDIGTNAEITYSIRSGNEHGKFSIHSLSGEYDWYCCWYCFT